MNIKIIILVALMLHITGCATLFNNNVQPITLVGSGEQAAKVEVNAPGYESYQLTVPTVIFSNPSSFNDVVVRVVDPCYFENSVKAGKKVNNYYWFNFLNLHGFYLDFLSGYMWDYNEQLVVPLELKDPDNTECNSGIAKVFVKAPLRSSSQLPQNNNLIGFGYLATLRLNESPKYKYDDTNPGGYIAYTRRLSEQLIINARFQSFSDDAFGLNSCWWSYYDCFSIKTEHDSLALSLRRYITPASSFFIGLGAAHIRLKQTIENYQNSKNYGFSYKTETLGSFMELGWLKQAGRVSFQFNAMIDLVDYRLTTHRLDKRVFNKIDTQVSLEHRQVAKSKLHSAARVSNVSLGISFAF